MINPEISSNYPSYNLPITFPFSLVKSLAKSGPAQSAMRWCADSYALKRAY